MKTLATEELRSLVLECLKQWAEQRGRQQTRQFADLVQQVKHRYAIRIGLEATWERDQNYWRDDNAQKLQHVVWDLIISRVLIPGPETAGNTGWPFLSLTDHGKSIAIAQRPVPYDPDNYLAHLQRVAVGIHPTAVAYVVEALATFRMGCYLASAVMLGCASERILGDLADSIHAAIGTPAKQTQFKKDALDGTMFKRVNAISDWCNSHNGQLVGDWQRKERLRTVDKVADFIRNQRNDAGHPQDPPAIPSHEETYAALMVFPDYCCWIYELKTNLDTRPGQIP
ncbi:hypothetical protein [Anatilimnocola floriformis]|uniref:hypothetical protein n=1 Tax=Anatilimnocola floriformis TaxID=2948575 RepID=UPI0020C51529|nr:hypothetical protein [Anatilimnocola floriformis]